MRIINVICLVVLSTISFVSVADLDWSTWNWGKSLYSENSADVTAIGTNDKGETTVFIVSASVALSKGSKQRIYFNLRYGEGKSWLNTCSLSEFEKLAEETYVKEQVWRIDGQNVKMSVYCNITSSGITELSATPSSYQGERFVQKRFMHSNDTVLIDNGSFKVNMSAIGFMKVWNSFGGDAL